MKISIEIWRFRFYLSTKRSYDLASDQIYPPACRVSWMSKHGFPAVVLQANRPYIRTSEDFGIAKASPQ